MRAQRDRAVREIDEAWQGLKQALARVPPERMEEGGVVGMWSVKDVIGHITTWENEAIDALRRYLPRGDVNVLAWPDLDAFNERTVNSKRQAPLDELLMDLETTHEQTVELVSGLTEEVLGVPEVEKRIRIDTFAHDAEHTGNIRRWLGEEPSV